jgi:hypothetical protein
MMPKLDCLFDIGAPDAIKEILKCRLLSELKKKDVDFYLDQRGNRKATMCGHDKVYKTKAKFYKQHGRVKQLI